MSIMKALSRRGGREERWEVVEGKKNINICRNWGCIPQELPSAGEGLFFEKNLQPAPR